MRRWGIISSLLLLFSLQTAYAASCPNNTLCDLELNMLKTGKTGSSNWDYVNRDFRVHIPTAARSAPNGASVLFVFHGSNGDDAEKISEYSEFTPLSKQHGFIVVYPLGINKWSNGPHWNDNRKEFAWHYNNIDDIAFVYHILDYLEQDLGVTVDRTHVFGAGMSNGGVFVHWAACKDPNLFRAIASVSASMSADMYNNQCQNAPAKPTLMIFGNKDKTMPYDSDGVLGKKGDGVSVFKALGLRGRLNSCSQQTETAWKNLNNQASVIDNVKKVPGSDRKEKTTYSQIDGNCVVPVRYIEAQEAGHRWHKMNQPKEALDFIPSFRVGREFNSQDKIVEFFAQNW